MNKFAFVYLGVDVALIVVSLFLGGFWLLNTQIAFISSMLIVFASFYSYKSMVEKKLEDGNIEEQRDILDKLDDKYELYEPTKSPEQPFSNEEFQEIYKQERQKVGGVKKSFSNLFKSWSGVLGVLRLLAYLVLFVSIMVLLRHGLFIPMAFIVGLSVVPFATMLLSFFHKN